MVIFFHFSSPFDGNPDPYYFIHPSRYLFTYRRIRDYIFDFFSYFFYASEAHQKIISFQSGNYFSPFTALS